MSNPIEKAYQSLDFGERQVIDDLSNELVNSFKKRAHANGRSGHKFGVMMARELLAKTNIFLTHKQSVSRTICEVDYDR
jgi:hypothetical protein